MLAFALTARKLLAFQLEVCNFTFIASIVLVVVIDTMLANYNTK